MTGKERRIGNAASSSCKEQRHLSVECHDRLKIDTVESGKNGSEPAIMTPDDNY